MVHRVECPVPSPFAEGEETQEEKPWGTLHVLCGFPHAHGPWVPLSLVSPIGTQSWGTYCCFPLPFKGNRAALHELGGVSPSQFNYHCSMQFTFLIYLTWYATMFITIGF